MKLITFLWIGIGGACGAILRYLVSGAMHSMFQKATLPVGTLTVNLVGCLLIGILGGLAETRQVLTPELRLFILIGGLGSFTTFSTFGYEVFQLLRDGQIILAITNSLIHVIVGLLAVWGGFMIARAV